MADRVDRPDGATPGLPRPGFRAPPVGRATGSRDAAARWLLRPAGAAAADGDPDHVWYAAYGSNMCAERLACYLRGGRPPGGARTYPGCRDGRPPERAVPVTLPGQLYFALESTVWGGGTAFYDPDRTGLVPARAYLLTTGQFSDIAAQERHRQPGADLSPATALRTGRDRLWPGRYGTLVCPGSLDHTPVLTLTASGGLADADLRAPRAAYLRTIAAGLVQAHGWDLGRIADYLGTRPGADAQWTPAALRRALAETVGDG
ncbi:histone deacetylase [Kitasatospora sp. NPDC086009]|uniref:histone deacetylase n=1 Tax=unclassified Kitasatospora TaxID=2633591 RepID=UPI0037CB2D91